MVTTKKIFKDGYIDGCEQRGIEPDDLENFQEFCFQVLANISDQLAELKRNQQKLLLKQ